MTTTRRDFIRTTAAAGAAAGVVGLPGLLARAARAAEPAPDPLKILVLGGTGQTGPHLVRRLIARGHTVTLFNRGRRSQDLFPDVECLVGNRFPEQGEGLTALEAERDAGREWDVVMDVWPHIPRLVEATAELLKDNAGHYMFVSSMSAYADHSQPNQDETAAVGEAPDADNTPFTMQLFGPFKAECENRVRRAFPVNHTVYRPGLIVGPRDFTFRGGYWPVRVRRGGTVLAPGSGDDRIQQIDARDLVDFQVLCMERATKGTFNVVGPHPRNPLTMRRYLEACKRVSGSDAEFVWADAEFLGEQGVHPWGHMPCWIPAEGDYAGFGSRSISKALRAGLTLRPIDDTVAATLAWIDGLDDEQRRGVTARAGLPAEREAEVLEAWAARPAEG